MDQAADDDPLPGAETSWTQADEEEFRRTHPRAPMTSDEELLEADTAAIVSQLDDAARLRRIQDELREGFKKLSHVGKAVSIFGSARTPRDDPMYITARDTAATLGRAGFSIITGGGPGIMEAGNRGARDAAVPSIGLDIELPHEQFEAATLRQTAKIRHFPIVLFGSAYWAGLVDWLLEQVAAAGNIAPEDAECLIVTDSVAEVLRVVQAAEH